MTGPKPEIAATKGVFVSLDINPTNIIGLIVTACSRSGLALDTSLYNLKNSIKIDQKLLEDREKGLCVTLISFRFSFLLLLSFT